MSTPFSNNNMWIIFDPFVFIFIGTSEYVLFHTGTQDYEVIPTSNNHPIIQLLDELLVSSNMYSTEISKYILGSKEYMQILLNLRDRYFCDILPSNICSQKPIALPPLLKIRNNYSNIQSNIELQDRNTVLNFFHELTIYVNGDCDKTCQHCYDYHKQFPFCTKNQYKLDIFDIQKIESLIICPNLSVINILGGNVLMYEYLEQLLQIISTRNPICSINIYIHLLNYDKQKINKIRSIKNLHIHVLIDLKFFNNRQNTNSLQEILDSQLCSIDFICSSQEDVSLYENISQSFNLTKCDMKPFYCSNEEFFVSNVFYTTDDILKEKHTRKNIFINQSLNIFNYGKLIITSDKRILDGINGNHIGFLGEDVYTIIFKCLNKKSSWFKTRDSFSPCSDCAFKFLCPPISHYESILKRYNFCADK